MKAPYDDSNFVRKLYKYKWCRSNLTVFKRVLLPDWSVYGGKITVKLRKIGKRNTQKKKGYETEKNLNMESDQPEIKVIAPLHEMPPLPTTENIMKTLNSDKDPNENKETATLSLSLMSDFGKDAKGNGNEADLGQDTGQDTSDEKKDARTEENGMKEDDDEVQHDTLELRTVNEIFSPVADLRQDTRNETEKNAGDPKPKENKKNMEVSEEIRDQGGGGVEGR